MEGILARLKLKDSRKVTPTDQAIDAVKTNQSLERLLTNLNGSNKTLKAQAMELRSDSESDAHKDGDRSSGSELYTPASETFDTISYGDNRDTVRLSDAEAAEAARVRKELAAARALIARQEQELAESRTLKHTMEQAMGPPSEADFSMPSPEHPLSNMQTAFNVGAPAWHPLDDSRSGSSDRMHARTLNGGQFNRARNSWNNNQAPQTQQFNNGFGANAGPMTSYGLNPRINAMSSSSDQSWGNHWGNQGISPPGFGPTQFQRSFSGSSSLTSMQGFDNMDSRMYQPLELPANASIGVRRNLVGLSNRGSGFSSDSSAFGGLTAGMPGGMNANSLGPIGAPGPLGYQPRPVGAQISPTTPDFSNMSGLSQWSPGVSGGIPHRLCHLTSSQNMSALSNSTYVTPLEPMNYRRLLDKTVSCDWKYIVDKIVCSNDQQASIFLQQKLKVGTAEQKFEIVSAIVDQAYPLMINRFGNFLIQRCFEHGTPEQVVAIANAIHGNVLSLSMDAFGCHVVQKAFDSVPENHKADMVRELLRRIPDTVIHRYACHVWQKLFELRWSGEPPQIMLKVNEALRGMWHEVALGETGSLVVQNIFENCVEEEKRPAIEEVVGSIDLIAHGQFGNWCIQHLCEHGSPPDKRRVIDHILANSYSYSIDQFASKVVEKCLKISGVEFLDRYLGVITTAHPDRPRIPLIDIAGDQYGNYLIQWILMNTHHHQREQVASHIRKHMVSLRGSKFGSRVAMLCCNPSQATRPGPGVVINPYGAPGQPRGGWSRQQFR